MLDWTLWTAVDWVVVVVLGSSVILSLWRGFMREAISLAGWIAAFVIANMYMNEMALLLASTISNVTGRYVAAYALLFVGTLLVAGMLRRLGTELVRATGLSLLDRLLGTAFGLARGVIIVLVVVYMLRQLVPPKELAWLDEARLIPHLDMLVQWVKMTFYDFGQNPGTGIAS